MDFGIASVAGITVICYLAGMVCKASARLRNEVIPVVCGVAGAALGVVGPNVETTTSLAKKPVIAAKAVCQLSKPSGANTGAR